MLHVDNTNNKKREKRGVTNTTYEFEYNRRSDISKIDNLSIHKKGKNDETPTYEVAALSVLFIISNKPWAIKVMRRWLQWPNYIP